VALCVGLGLCCVGGGSLRESLQRARLRTERRSARWRCVYRPALPTALADYGAQYRTARLRQTGRRRNITGPPANKTPDILRRTRLLRARNSRRVCRISSSRLEDRS
jgi:hypothetical protein